MSALRVKSGGLVITTLYFVPQTLWTHCSSRCEALVNFCCQGKVLAEPVKAENLAGPWAGASSPFYILKWILGTFSFASMPQLLAVTWGKVLNDLFDLRSEIQIFFFFPRLSWLCSNCFVAPDSLLLCGLSGEKGNADMGTEEVSLKAWPLVPSVSSRFTNFVALGFHHKTLKS